MKGSLVLGKVAGIKIQVHWTFTLLLLWVLFSNLRQGGDRYSALFSIGLVLVLFLCVVLHERIFLLYEHAFVALVSLPMPLAHGHPRVIEDVHG